MKFPSCHLCPLSGVNFISTPFTTITRPGSGSELSRSSGPSACTGPVICLHSRPQFVENRHGRRLRSRPPGSFTRAENPLSSAFLTPPKYSTSVRDGAHNLAAPSHRSDTTSTAANY
ncbi:hypothetical protein CCUS01_15165 [Colletotrichum cuscutae]|uniref:Uncharacterized protein n=1 Tax=Colletotrichum cuscutae TaxID=1209917 RepID=A0AAI9VIH0_9PEZI|nr:hypothetical protein CCUS01_15165 [Colletotrichum cuscutae]